jgi:hypothetical protein
MDKPLIGPQPQYPTPWGVAEKGDRGYVIVCSEGHQAATAPSAVLAELIVTAVNAMAGEYAAVFAHRLTGRPDGSFGCACGWKQDKPHAEHLADVRRAMAGDR